MRKYICKKLGRTTNLEFDFSNGWLCGFMGRYNLSSQMRTEKKIKVR